MDIRLKDGALKKLFRIIWGILLAFIQVTLLVTLIRLIFKSDGLAGLAFLAGWPALVWRNLRKPPTKEKSQPTLLRHSAWALVALPIIVAIPLFAFISSLKGQGSDIVALVAIALLLIVTAASWGAATITFIAGQHRKKSKAPEA